MTDETREQIKRDATIYAANGDTIKACINCGCHEDQSCKWGGHGSEYDCNYVSHDIPDVFSPLRQRTLNAFTDGATHQHPISFDQGKKEGWNEAIAVVTSYMISQDKEGYAEYIESLKKNG